MKKITVSLLFAVVQLASFGQWLCDLEGNESPTWQQTITMFQQLADASPFAKLLEVGKTDVGKPLHLMVITTDSLFYPELFDRSKTIVFINNAIHPGEPDGVNASLLLARDLLDMNSAIHQCLDSVIVCILPMYNVDGALMRNSFTRANQDGPYEYGFRGNARNLDLNRDFMKCDSKNALSFNRLFSRIQPTVFVDTHVSNGADYSYTMTLITSQSNKLGFLGAYMKESMEPALFEAMKKRGHEMTPYVNTMGRTPDSGLVEFLETPRFASGYAALFQCFPFITETHMLKPFPARVQATRVFLEELIGFSYIHSTSLIREKRKAEEALLRTTHLPLKYELDTTARDAFFFKGYTARYQPSEVGTGERLFYDKTQPWEKDIPFYNRYRDTLLVEVPGSYVVPQAWWQVIERLKANGVQMYPLRQDTVLEVEAYFIEKYTTAKKPYEGHFPHTQVQVRKEKQRLLYFAGDMVVPTSQRARRYLVEALEPQGEDSFFAWNFFDAILQRKEYFSDYVFEEKAAELLAENPRLKEEFEVALKVDSTLANNHWDQLYWIYTRSIYAERSVMRYPVARW